MTSCLVLNNAYQPVGVIDERNALCLLLENKAIPFVNHNFRVYRSQYLTLAAPLVIVLNKYVQIRGFRIRPEKLTSLNLFKRDEFKCWYCGRTKKQLRNEKLTKDHILPKIRGGQSEWLNVITACESCNVKKGNRTPEEAEMKLLKEPTVPMTWSIRGKSQLNRKQMELVESYIGVK